MPDVCKIASVSVSTRKYVLFVVRTCNLVCGIVLIPKFPLESIITSLLL